MTKFYKIGYKRKMWQHFTHDFDRKDYATKVEAQKRKRELQKLGFIQVIIKMKRNQTSISEVS